MKRLAFVSGAATLAAVPRIVRASTVDAALASEARASSGTLGVYARKLDAPTAIAYDADEVFPAASVIKVLILVSLFQFAKTHTGVFDHRVTLARDDFVGGSEILDGYSIGSSITIDRLARAMIQQSDNTASNVLINYVGFERIAQTAKDAGLASTHLKRHFMDVNAVMHHSENLTTPRDMGTLLYQIERGAHEGVPTVASSADCRRMLQIMLGQEDRDKIARGLPKGTPLANKTGEIDGVRNDVGVVDPFGESPYAIAVLTKDLGDFSLGNIAIRRVAKTVHGVFG